MSFKLIVVSVVVLVLFFACGKDGKDVDQSDDDGPTPSNEEPAIGDEWFRPVANVSWQWQLLGTVNTTYDVDIYDIDLFDSPQALIKSLQDVGKKVICYFSAGSYENWREDAGSFDGNVRGKPLDEWEGEAWLDIRSKNVHQVMLKRLDLAKQKGCDGVEPDNVDGYTNDTGFPLQAEDQLIYNKFLAEGAHQRGLAVGLKNNIAQVAELVGFFDFSINEQCHEYNECEDLKLFIQANKPVFNIEYAAKYVENKDLRSDLCDSAAKSGFHTLVMPLNLDDTFRMSCK